MLLLGLAVGMMVGYVLARRQGRTLLMKNESLTEQMRLLATDRDVFRSKQETAEARLEEVKTEAEQRLTEAKTEGGKRLEEQKVAYEKQLDEQQSMYEKRLEELKTQQREQLVEQMRLIKAEMNAASEKILKERAAELSTNNEQQLAHILNPLRENIQQMKEAVEKSDRAQTVTMERLDASIKENLKQAQEVGERADKLAQALTSENKTQGNFGELRLKQLLEEMGLEEGVQFEEQTTLRDEQGRTVHDEEEGHRLIPDVILHFPDRRDVIIDSKMSFTAFQDYFNAKSDEEREAALRRHLMSVRQHVNELSRKNYSRYVSEGRQRLDFVMMYVFSESALQLALSNDPTLWKEAYDKGVIIAGSQTLYIMLRVLEMTWKQVRQVENQQEIMKTANMIVERVQLFYERFLKVDEQLHKTGEAFEDLKRSTASSGQSITTAAAKLLKYGAQENPKRKQRLPSSQLPESDGSSSSDVE